MTALTAKNALPPDSCFEYGESIVPSTIMPEKADDGAMIVHIPARGGSTRLPGKNTMLLNGVPLVAYTILLALRLPVVEHVVVNTDSEEIAEIARSYGAEVPFLRPKSIAGRKASLADAESYMLGELRDRGISVRSLITLLPTSPFRNLQRVSEMVFELERYKRVATAHYVKVDWEDYLVSREGTVELLSDHMKRRIPRGCYIKPNGMFTGRHMDLELKRVSLYHMVTDPVELVDIDNRKDLDIGEEILANNLFDFGFSI